MNHEPLYDIHPRAVPFMRLRGVTEADVADVLNRYGVGARTDSILGDPKEDGRQLVVHLADMGAYVMVMRAYWLVRLD